MRAQVVPAADLYLAALYLAAYRCSTSEFSMCKDSKVNLIINWLIKCATRLCILFFCALWSDYYCKGPDIIWHRSLRGCEAVPR